MWRRSASALGTTLRSCLSPSENPDRPPRPFMRRVHFNVWSRKKRIEKLGYMHMDPREARIGRVAQELAVEFV